MHLIIYNYLLFCLRRRHAFKVCKVENESLCLVEKPLQNTMENLWIYSLKDFVAPLFLTWNVAVMNGENNQP